jgi:hypothetical protein
MRVHGLIKVRSVLKGASLLFLFCACSETAEGTSDSMPSATSSSSSVVPGSGSSAADSSTASPQAAASTGVCLGELNIPDLEGMWCVDHFQYDESGCASVAGCTWSAGGFCTGTPTACSTYPEAECTGLDYCEWYGPPRCATDEECVTAWLIEDGACALVPSIVGASCSGGPRPVFIDYGALCNGYPPQDPSSFCQ